MLEKLCDRFKRVVQTDAVQPRTVCAFLAICGHIDYKPEELIRACKRHFVSNAESYTPLEVQRIVSTMRILNELDDPILEALEKTTYAALPVMHHPIEGRRELCKLLITLRILQDKVKAQTGTFKTG